MDIGKKIKRYDLEPDDLPISIPADPEPVMVPDPEREPVGAPA